MADEPDGEGKRKVVRTMPGYGPPDKREVAPPPPGDDDPTAEDPPAATAAASPDAGPPTEKGPLGRASEPPSPRVVRRGTPLVEIEVVHEHGPAPSTDRPWRTVEIWTRNRVYTLDSRMICVEVMDRATRAVVEDHPFLGMRLVGGQHREGEKIELSYPFPRPSTEAVFEQATRDRRGGTFSRTSAVTRVVLRLHIVTVAPSYVVPTWEEITGSLLPPPPDTNDRG
jgi:hypothetical protein